MFRFRMGVLPIRRVVVICCWLYGALSLAGSFGCAAVVMGGAAAAGAYVVAKDERSVAAQIDDSAVVLEITERFVRDPEVSTLHIDITAVQGLVTLKGEIPDEERMEEVLQITGSVPGVHIVKNEMQIKN